MMLLRGLLAFYTNLDTSDHRTKSKDDGEEVLVERSVFSHAEAWVREDEIMRLHASGIKSQCSQSEKPSRDERAIFPRKANLSSNCSQVVFSFCATAQDMV